MAMKEVFSNNAASSLAQALGGDYESTTADVADASRFYSMSGTQEFQRATISNKAMPGIVEVVKIVARDGNLLTLVRGEEQTYPQAWPAGSKFEARLTAGQLKSFIQVDDDGVVHARGEHGQSQGSFIVNGRVPNDVAGVVQISGVQMLQARSAELLAYAAADSDQDLSMSVESVGGSIFVELGDDIPTYAEGGFYSPRSIVKPPTPTGYNYLLDLVDSSGENIYTPVASFDASGDVFAAVASDGVREVGNWVPVPDPLDITLRVPSGVAGLVLSEVGFICTSHQASTAPVVSILVSDDDGVSYTVADHVALESITKRNQAHRIPVVTYGGGVKNFQFRLDAPAAGKFYGRFYWRGFFFSGG